MEKIDIIKTKKGRRRDMFEKDGKIEYINLVGDINYENANQIIHHIFQANRKSDAIVMCVSTCGGDIYAGMSIMDAMRFVNTPVFTYAIGLVGSMGVNVFLEGQKRFVSPTASFMVHGSEVEYSGNFQTIESTLQYEKYFDNYLNERIVANTRFTKDELDKLLNKKIDVYFTPDKILEYGFVDNQNKIIQTQRELEIEINNYLKEK
jgi:ATP-dependent Clp protease, protease subunit